MQASLCDNATRISAGQILGTTADAGNTFRFVDTNGCQGSASIASATAGDRVFVVAVPANQRLTATLAFPDGGDTLFDSTFNLMSSLANCGSLGPDGGIVGLACAAGVDDPEPQTLRFDNEGAAARDVFLLVDGYSSGMGEFGMQISFGSIPPFLAGGDTCSNPAVLTPGTFARSTTDGGLPSNFGFATVNQCRSSNVSPDRTFSLTVPAVTRATIDVLPASTFDPIVNVIEGTMNCGMTNPDGGTSNAVCVAGSTVFGAGAAERVVVNNVATSPATYTIIVDSSSTSARLGDFEIGSTLTSLPPRLSGGETCAAPVALTPGSIVGSTQGTVSDYAFASAAACRASSAVAGDVVYSVTVPPASNATVVVTSLTAGFVPSVNVIANATNCGTQNPDGGTGGATCITSNSSSSTLAFSNSTAGMVTYLIVVDATTSSAPLVGGFQLDYSVAPIPQGDTCAGPDVIMMSGTITGQTTVGFSNTVGAGPGCTNFASAYAGRDRIYSVMVAPGQTLTATVTPTTSFDPGVYFILAPASNCLATGSMCVGSGDDTNGGGVGMGAAETGTYTNSGSQPQEVFIVVDSFSASSAGGFDLTIGLVP